MWAHVNLFNRSPLQIWRDLFFCVRVTLRYVDELCKCARDGEQVDRFLFPTKKRSGVPKLKGSSNAAAHLLAHMRSHDACPGTFTFGLRALRERVQFAASVDHLPHAAAPEVQP